MTFTCTCGAAKPRADEREAFPQGNETPDSRRDQACVCFETVSLHERLSETKSAHDLASPNPEL